MRTEELDYSKQFTVHSNGYIFLPSWSAVALNVAIISPQQPHNQLRWGEDGFALTNAEEGKHDQELNQCSEIGVKIVPLAFMSFGGF